MPSNNPRYANPKKRNDLRKWFIAQEYPCALCGKPIDYTLTTYRDPKDDKLKRHPMSFELDEIVPISKGGSPIDINNLQATHRICNQRKGNKTNINNDYNFGALPWSREW